MSQGCLYFAGIVTGLIFAYNLPETVKDAKHVLSVIKLWF